MRPPDEEPVLSADEIIVTEAFRRRLRAITERCLPAIIAEERYENVEELMAVFRWFGSPEAMRLPTPADYQRVPGLTLEEASALARFRVKRREYWAPRGDPDALKPCPPTPKGLVRVYLDGKIWYVDPTTEKIVSEAPL